MLGHRLEDERAVGPEAEQRRQQDTDGLGDVQRQQSVYAEAVLGQGQDAEFDDQAGAVEKEEQDVFPPECRFRPIPVRPVTIHQIRRDRGDNRRDHSRFQLTVAENRECQGIEHRVIDDGVDAADDAEFERLVDELLPALGQQTDSRHAEHLRQWAGPARPGGSGWAVRHAPDSRSWLVAGTGGVPASTKTNRRYDQNRKSVPRPVPTMKLAMLSASGVWNTAGQTAPSP